MRYTLYSHVQPTFPAKVVGFRREKDASLPWITAADVARVKHHFSSKRFYLRLRDNHAGEVYVDEAWSDEIVD
jgi:hypothetical protein